MLEPTHRYRCDECGDETTGPEHPGYLPYCPQCGVPLAKTPIVPKQKP